MTNINEPDFKRFPRLREALDAGEVADLEPGDVLFYPTMWWHEVEARDSFNVMVNYWWNTSPEFIDTPQNTLLHALLSLRDRPEQEKRAWRAVFDYYVFGEADRAAAHLPEAARGNLAPMDELKARRLRALLLRRLNR
jgi:ribosomal protein L16 Arg81 hydroxylase